jgi:inhibitor of cysteine peptidase
MTIELTSEDSGTTRSVHVGERMTVRLTENPTTGYRWQADHDDTRLRLVEDRYDGPQSPRGAGGERVLTFEVLLAGQTTLRLADRRSWGDGEPVELFEVELDAQPVD